MKKAIVAACIVITVVVFLYFSKPPDQIFNIEKVLVLPDAFSYAQHAHEICYGFVHSSLLAHNGGVYTNYLETADVSQDATGHEYLSESSGLVMLYDVLTDQQEHFEQELLFLERTMKNAWGLYRWRALEGQSLTDVAATIDDLRIIRALMAAYMKWHNAEHLEKIEAIASSLYDKHVYQQFLVNDYDGNKKSKLIDLAYLDLLTINELQTIDPRWRVVYQNAFKVVQDGFVSQDVPLYFKEFNIKSQQIKKTTTINMIDVALVYLHLAEMDALPPSVIPWLIQQFNQDGRIYEAYRCSDAQPVSTQECTAIYALLARMARQMGDDSLYERCVNRMLQFQVTDITHPLYGSFGDIETMMVYSYDNLQALLALAK